MFRLCRLLLLGIAPFLVLTLIGCSKGPKVVKVEGVLTYKGKPVPAGVQIDFSPENGRPSWGETDDSGHFTLEYDRTQKGALVGKHKISLRRKMKTRAEQEAEMRGETPPVDRQLGDLFTKYNAANSKKEVTIDKETTDLRVDLD